MSDYNKCNKGIKKEEVVWQKCQLCVIGKFTKDSNSKIRQLLLCSRSPSLVSNPPRTFKKLVPLSDYVQKAAFPFQGKKRK